MTETVSIDREKQSNSFLEEIEDLPPERESVIPALQGIQKSHGYLPKQALETVSSYTKTPLAKVYGIATFYSQFHLEPQGEHTIKVFQDPTCQGGEAEEILKRLTKELGIMPGEVTSDGKFTLTTISYSCLGVGDGCLGTYDSPVMMVDNDVYEDLTSEEATKILEDYE